MLKFVNFWECCNNFHIVIVVLNTFYTENVQNNKFQVQLGQIVHVHQAIFVISCKNVYILLFLYVQIQGCGRDLVQANFERMSLHVLLTINHLDCRTNALNGAFKFILLFSHARTCPMFFCWNIMSCAVDLPGITSI